MGSIASQYNTSIIGTFFQDFTGVIANSFFSFREFIATSRAERELRLLDDRMLADIGLNRSDITYAVRRGKSR
jgi:uncharacterized protein YjiS (DUF1127 family)